MNIISRDINSLAKDATLKPTIILISATIITAAHRCFGSMEFALEVFGCGRCLTATFFVFGTAFLLMGIVPLMITHGLFKEHIRSYGICVGKWKEGGVIVLTLLPVIAALLLYPASRTLEIQSYYPLAREGFDSMENFLLLQFSRGVLFYTAWEFFFRGFMLFGLRKYVGDWMAICIQMIPQCLWHIGLPTGELFSSIASGILFGLMAIRTGSILWPFLLHYAIGVSLDILIYLQL